jgi:EpsI family protein
MSAVMLVAAVIAPAFAPSQMLADTRPAFNLEQAIPRQFGDWQEEVSAASNVINPQANLLLDKLYSQVLSRSYINSKGYRVMLSIAYGRDQRGSLQLHYPEVCYPVQGFQVLATRNGVLNLPDGRLNVRMMETSASTGRVEPLTYWTLVGDVPSLGGLRKKLIESKYALKGYVPDGILVRASSIDADSSRAFAEQSQFFAELIGSLAASSRERIRGEVALD